MSISGRRTPMILYSTSADQYCHRVRLVLAEKRIPVKEIAIDQIHLDDNLVTQNPTGRTPTLIDRDLVLYHSTVIMEYLDERYPHPPLLPVYPVARAEARLMIQRIEAEWATRLDYLLLKRRGGKTWAKVRDELKESIVSLAHQFSDQQKYFLNNEFTIVDCCAAPVLWRLGTVGINKLPELQTKHLMRYMDFVFQRDTFRSSLSDVEEEMRRI